MRFGTYATIWNPANKTLRKDILRNVADTKFGIDRTGKNHNNYVQYHIKKKWDELDKDVRNAISLEIMFGSHQHLAGIRDPLHPPKQKFLKKAGLNPHVHTKIQLKKMTKAGLIRLVIKLEKFIVSHAYEMYKSKLPRLRTRSDPIFGDLKIPKSKRTMPISLREQIEYRKPRTKRKKLTGAAKAKFLARMNKGRRKKGLKPIRSR